MLINGDRRLYEKSMPKDIMNGDALVVWVGKDGWATIGGGRIKDKLQAEKYASKLNNLIQGLKK